MIKDTTLKEYIQLQDILYKRNEKDAWDKFNNTTFLYSEKYQLVCNIEDDGSLWIVNGEWRMHLVDEKENKYLMHTPSWVPEKESYITVDDLVEKKYGDFTASERVAMYLPEKPYIPKSTVIKDQWDDDIPF